jgi:hypothetical protein
MAASSKVFHVCPFINSGGAVAERDSRSLTEEQRKQLQDWLFKHWKGDKRCPFCHSANWAGPQYVVQPITHAPMGTLLLGGGPGYPMVMVTCETCGYTMSFSAVVAGLFPKQEVANAKP